MHALGLEFGSAAHCLKGRVVCGTVYGEMHLKNLLGSFVRVGYHIPVPDFYLVLHGLRCRKSTIMDQTNKLLLYFTCISIVEKICLNNE